MSGTRNSIIRTSRISVLICEKFLSDPDPWERSSKRCVHTGTASTDARCAKAPARGGVEHPYLSRL